ncbi:MAG: GAF domain-containing protein [bacterium]|nr:GAF domain-containing protein [bacterium]
MPIQKIEKSKRIDEILDLLEMFYDISTLLTLGTPLDQLLRNMFEKVSVKTKIISVLVWLLDEKKEFFDLAASHNIPSPLLATMKISRMRSNEGTAGVVLRTKKFYLMKDISTDPHAKPEYQKTMKELNIPIKAVASFPMIVEREFIGVFSFFFSGTKQSISRTDFIVFSSIANQIASFVQSSRIFQELQKKVEELERFQKVTLGRELKMVDLKKEIKKMKEKSE